MSMNQISLMGRLTRDPELRRTGSGTAVASFTVAVDRDYSDKQTGEKGCDFIDCVAWRSGGEFVAKHFRKGKQIALTGRLEIREWTDKEGNKRKSAEVVVANVYFCGPREAQEGGTSQGGAYTTMAENGRPGSGGDYADTLAYAQSLMNKAPASDYAMLEGEDAQLPF
jgi:single-strand DNA-binding protein